MPPATFFTLVNPSRFRNWHAMVERLAVRQMTRISSSLFSSCAQARICPRGLRTAPGTRGQHQTTAYVAARLLMQRGFAVSSLARGYALFPAAEAVRALRVPQG